MQIVLFILSLSIAEISSQPCTPQNVKLLNLPTHHVRSKPFTVKSKGRSCPGLKDLYYEWEVKDLSTNQIVQKSTSPSLEIDGFTYDYKNIFSKTYQVTHRMSHYKDMAAAATVSDTFKFIPDKMIVKFTGGSKISLPLEPVIVVDARTLSKDPSFKEGETSIEEYNIKWSVNPTIEGFDPDGLEAKIPSSALKVNQTYKFTVEVTRSKMPPYSDIVTATQEVTITPPGNPKIIIKCLRNCENSNPQEKTSFRAVCLEKCHLLQYQWEIEPKVDDSLTDLGTGYDEFVIEPGAFEEGDKVQVVLKSGMSTATYSLEFKKKMKKGTCVINPKEGVSGKTLFNIKCTNFTSSGKKLKYLIYQMSDEKGVLVHEASFESESNVLLSVGNPAKIVVEVQDSDYEKVTVELEAEVSPYPVKTVEELINAIRNTSFDDSMPEQQRNDVIQTVSYLLDAIDSIDSITDENKKLLHKYLAENLDKLISNEFDSSRQIILLLRKFEKYKLKTDTETSRAIAQTVLSAALVIIAEKHNDTVPLVLIKNLMEDVFDIASKLLDEVPEFKSVLETEIPAHDYDTYDEMTSPKLSLKDDLRSVLSNMFLSIQALGIYALRKDLPDEKPIVFQNDLINLEIRRIKLTTLLKNQTISLTGNTENKVIAPKPLVRELQAKYSYVDYQFGVLQKNPFYWYLDSLQFSTDIVLFDFFHKNLKIRSPKNPFELHLKVKSISTGVIKGNLNSKDVVAHRVEVQPGSMLIIVFKSQEESFKVAASKCYCKEEDFDKGIEIRHGLNEAERTLRVKTFQNKNVYVCIKKSGAELYYEGDFAMFSCLHWNFKDQSWKSDESYCTVKKASLEEEFLICECSHLSFFAGKIFAPPNRINLNTKLDFFITMVKNWFAFALIVSLLIVWCILIIIAVIYDRKLKQENKILSLDDNVPGDPIIYAVVVFTGVFIDAGTTADVAFQLIGEKGKSRVHIIKCKGVRMLQRHSQDWFVINTPTFLGDLKTIRLWHNCRGTEPHWYCKRVVVQHLKSGIQYSFVVEKWFSLIWGSGKIYREIQVKDQTDLNSRKLLLSLNVETNFKDKHLWVSVFTRDTQSNFSSLERVGSVGCAFFLSMLASAMFYGIPRNVPADSIDPKSSYFVTYNDFAIFLESWLVGAPIGIIVVLIFRNSAPRLKYIQ